MIRNYQRSSSNSDVDLSPIYNSLATINALLYKLDVQTTIPQAINSISNSIINLNEDINEITNRTNYSLAYYITDYTLTKAITDYQNYNQLSNVEIFEPYVQLIDTLDFINDNRGFKYNLPNCTLNASQYPEFMAVRYLPITLNKYMNGNMNVNNASVKTLSNCNIEATRCSFDYIYANNCNLLNCDLQYVSCDLNCNIQGCIIPQITMNMGRLKNCYIYSLKTPNTINSTNTTRNVRLENCTIANYASMGCIYSEMTINNVTNALECNFSSCVINCLNTNNNYSFSNCSFNEASIYHLTNTNFINCSGNIYIPKIVNGSVLFDLNNNFLGNLEFTSTITTNSTYESTYSSTYLTTDLNQYTTELTTNYYVTDWYTSMITDTAISRVTTDTIISNEADLPMYPTTTTIDLTITLSSTNTLTSTVTTILTITENGITTTFGPVDLMTSSTYEGSILSTETYTETTNITDIYTSTYTINTEYIGNLSVLCLPEWKFNLSPNQVEISSIYSDQYINLEYYRNSTPYISISNCNGKIDLEVNSLSTLIISGNDLKYLNLDIENYTTTSLIQNTINNCVLNFYPQLVGLENMISSNSINNLTVYNNFTEHSIIFKNNTVLNGDFDANVNNASYRHSLCSYNNLHLKGWNGLYSCSIGYLENEGEVSMSKCSLNTGVFQNIALLYDVTADKIIINPNNYDQYSFMGNSIKTLICPSNFTYMTEINTIGTKITY